MLKYIQFWPEMHCEGKNTPYVRKITPWSALAKTGVMEYWEKNESRSQKKRPGS